MTSEEFDKELAQLDIRERGLARWFKDMGFLPTRALILVTAKAHPLQVQRALSRGCTRDQAFDIWT